MLPAQRCVLAIQATPASPPSRRADMFPRAVAIPQNCPSIPPSPHAARHNALQEQGRHLKAHCSRAAGIQTLRQAPFEAGSEKSGGSVSA